MPSVTSEDARILREMRDWWRQQRTRLGFPDRRAHQSPDVQTVRVTSTTRSSGRFPGKLLQFNDVDSYTDLADVWVVGSNDEDLRVGRYANCRRRGEENGRPVFETDAGWLDAAGVAPSGNAAMAYVARTDKTILNTTTETTLISSTGNGSLVMGPLQVGDVLRITARGIHSGGSTLPADYRVRIKLASTTVADSTALADPEVYTNTSFHLHATLTVRTAGSSGLVMAQGVFQGEASGGLAEYGPILDTAATPSLLTPTLDVTWQFSNAHASNTITVQQFFFEWLRTPS